MNIFSFLFRFILLFICLFIFFFLIFSKETFGIMGDSATAMRDPIFYRWHAFINEIFLEHKNTLPAYTIGQVIYLSINNS